MWTRLLLLYSALLASALALTVQINYRYDTNNFFSAADNPGSTSGAAEARAALQAEATSPVSMPSLPTKTMVAR